MPVQTLYHAEVPMDQWCFGVFFVLREEPLGCFGWESWREGYKGTGGSILLCWLWCQPLGLCRPSLQGHFPVSPAAPRQWDVMVGMLPWTTSSSSSKPLPWALVSPSSSLLALHHIHLIAAASQISFIETCCCLPPPVSPLDELQIITARGGRSKLQDGLAAGTDGS